MNSNYSNNIDINTIPLNNILNRFGYLKDPKESSNKWIKYRNNESVIIVNQDTNTWWNPKHDLGHPYGGSLYHLLMRELNTKSSFIIYKYINDNITNINNTTNKQIIHDNNHISKDKYLSVIKDIPHIIKTKKQDNIDNLIIDIFSAGKLPNKLLVPYYIKDNVYTLKNDYIIKDISTYYNILTSLEYSFNDLSEYLLHIKDNNGNAPISDSDILEILVKIGDIKTDGKKTGDKSCGLFNPMSNKYLLCPIANKYLLYFVKNKLCKNKYSEFLICRSSNKNTIYFIPISRSTKNKFQDSFVTDICTINNNYNEDDNMFYDLNKYNFTYKDDKNKHEHIILKVLCKDINVIYNTSHYVCNRSSKDNSVNNKEQISLDKNIPSYINTIIVMPVIDVFAFTYYSSKTYKYKNTLEHQSKNLFIPKKTNKSIYEWKHIKEYKHIDLNKLSDRYDLDELFIGKYNNREYLCCEHLYLTNEYNYQYKNNFHQLAGFECYNYSDKKRFCAKKRSSGIICPIFNVENIILLVESFIDGLSYLELHPDKTPIIASSAGGLCNMYLKTIDYLLSINKDLKIEIAFDNDEAGIQYFKKIEKYFSNRLSDTCFQISKTAKDWNEILIRNKILRIQNKQ